MLEHDLLFFSTLNTTTTTTGSDHPIFSGGLFLDDHHHRNLLPPAFLSFPFSNTKSKSLTRLINNDNAALLTKKTTSRGLFLSVSFSINQQQQQESVVVEESEEEEIREATLLQHQENGYENTKKKVKAKSSGSAALNTTKHLWSGAFATMVARTCLAPLERLKLEYVIRGEQKNLFELIRVIGAAEGLKGFWKGNFINILRTAPFKSINFYAFDTYRSQLLKLSGNKESTNFERFLAGAAAGVTASLLCLPLDTVRTKMVAPGGEALGGIIGAFCHMIRTEGFFSLYKGLVPSLVSMAPSGAVFYGVYDILKTAYLNSPEGKKRIQNLKQEGEELNALKQLELGAVRTLLYGAIAGCCSEAAAYPFEVVRRHLQMQVRETKMNALATTFKIVEQGGLPALYAGLLPSLLQVLPSAAISYFVYELMKVVLKVES